VTAADYTTNINISTLILKNYHNDIIIYSQTLFAQSPVLKNNIHINYIVIKTIKVQDSNAYNKNVQFI